MRQTELSMGGRRWPDRCCCNCVLKIPLGPLRKGRFPLGKCVSVRTCWKGTGQGDTGWLLCAVFVASLC